MWPIPNLTRYLAIGLAACLALTLVLLNRAWNEVTEKTAVIDSMHREAQAYKEKSETTAKETGDAYQALLAQIKTKDLALTNARARFGSCNVARGIGADSVLRNHDATGEADSTERADDAGSQSLVVTDTFINDCALDAGQLQLWQEWAVKNKLPVENP